MNSIELINSIISKVKPLETKADGKLISVEKSGWMSKKQSDYLISLIQKEGDEQTAFGFAFFHNGVRINKPAPNGARTWTYYQRFD